jgi:hypothetical protein|nr:hypothetical protein [Oxalobacteraceae bacterium]
MAEPNPTEVAPWYLRNITQALALDEVTGNVYMRTGFAGNIVIEGNVQIPGTVTVDSTPENPVHVHLDEIGTSGILNVPYMPIGNTNVTVTGGNVSVSGNVGIIGNVAGITGNVTVNPITGNVGIIGNLAGITANVTVVDGGGSLTVDGNVNATITSGNVTVTPSLSVGDFYGEPYAIPITPVVQTDGRYGTNNYDHQIYTASSGNVSHTGGAFTVTCSGTTGSYALLRSRRFNTFKPGQTFMARWFAKFDTARANISQRLGVQNQENSYYFGYNGTQFGVLHSYNGRAPIYRITVNSYSGAQTVTIVLNSVTYTVSISAGLTTGQVANQISNANFGGLWLASDKDNTVELLYTGTLGPLGGTFSISGAGTFSGSISQDQAGVVATNNWFYDGTDFNMPAWFDGQLYNQYQVKYSWAGINFFVLNPSTGQYELFYQLIWAGSASATQLPVSNPAFKIAALALNSGSGTGVTIDVASMMSGLEGITNRNSYTGAIATTKTTLTQNVLHHLLSIQNPYTWSNTINTIETLLNDFVATTQCNDPTEVYLYLDAALSTGVQDFVSQDGYPVTVSTATGTFDPATVYPILSFVVGNTGSSVQFALEAYRLVVPPGSTVSVAIRSTASIQKAAASLVWYND